MNWLKRIFPILFLAACAGGAAYVALHVSLHRALGAQCELKENFAAAGRPAYWHHCVCWGLKYNENPPPAPNADATRCFGLVRKSWIDTDEIAIKDLADRERAARNQRMFEKLAPDAQARVQDAYKKLQKGAFRNDYPYVLEQAKVILLEVDDYGETKALETMAREALEARSPPPPALEPPRAPEPIPLNAAPDPKVGL